MKKFIITMWRENLQLRNGGSYRNYEVEARTESSARKKAEKIAAAVLYGSMSVVSVDPA